MYYDTMCFSVTQLSFVSASLKTNVLWALLSPFALQFNLPFPSMTIEDLYIPRAHPTVTYLLTGPVTPFTRKSIFILIVREEELKMVLEGLDGVRIKCDS